MTNKTILEKNDFFSDYDSSLGSHFAPKHATCDFQLNLTHCFAGTLNTKLFHFPFSVCPPSLLPSIVQQRTIFKKKEGTQFFGDIGLHSIIE